VPPQASSTRSHRLSSTTPPPRAPPEDAAPLRAPPDASAWPERTRAAAPCRHPITSSARGRLPAALPPPSPPTPFFRSPIGDDWFWPAFLVPMGYCSQPFKMKLISFVGDSLSFPKKMPGLFFPQGPQPFPVLSSHPSAPALPVALSDGARRQQPAASRGRSARLV
jgi:hypothetical protein